MKPASIALLLFFAALPLFAAPGPFTLSGNEKCWTSDPPPRPGTHLSWTASANAVSFDIFRNGQFRQTLPFGGSGTFDEAGNDVMVGQTYSYYMVAHDNSGGTFTSNTVDIFISGNVCQPPPAAPVLDGSAACDTTGPRAIVNLTWSGSPTATSFQIFRNNSPLTSTTGTAYTDSTVNPGVTYNYKVVASNSGGSTDSNTKSISVSESICPPGPLTATATAFCAAGPPVTPAAHVEWTASAFAASYVVKRDGTAVSGTLSSSTTSFDDFSGVTAGQTYNYTVVAANPSGNATSPPASVTITGLACTPPPPGSFAASANQLCNLGAPAAHVTWNPSTFANTYVVNRDGTAISGSFSSGTTSFDDVNVTPGQTYTYTVTATSGGGTTTSAPATLTIASCDNGNGNAPSPFNASVNAFCNSGSPAVRVTWTAGSGATSYVVNRNGTQVSGTLSSVTLTYDDTSVSAGQSYTYTVVGSNAGGSTAAAAGSITPSANVCPPSAFTLTASATCNPIVSPPQSMVTLNWSAAATATSYLILRNGAQVASVDGSMNSVNDGAGSGTYSYVVRAVGPGGTTDSNAATVTVPPNLCSTPRPDLAAADITFAFAAVHAGDTVAVAITVTNADVAAPATTSRIRIGSGTTVSPSDPILASIATPPLAAGASDTKTTTVTIPNLAAGTYYLFLSVDDDHVAGDVNPSNDVKRSAAFTFPAQSPPCTLACAAIVPTSAQATTSVAFAIERPPCVNDRAVWTFGDGASATSYSPAHAYATTGTFHWALTLTAATGETCSSIGNITITAPTVPPKRRAVHH